MSCGGKSGLVGRDKVWSSSLWWQGCPSLLVASLV